MRNTKEAWRVILSLTKANRASSAAHPGNENNNLRNKSKLVGVCGCMCGRQLPSRWKKRIAWHITRILVSDTSKKFWIHKAENCRRGRGDLHLDLTLKKKNQKQRTRTVFRQALQIVIVKRVFSFLKTTKK